MLLAVARADANVPKKLFDHLEWIMKCVKKLSESRNDAIHTHVIFIEHIGGVATIPHKLSARRQAIDRLRVSPTAAHWRKVCGDLNALTDFCHAIYEHSVVAGLQGTWPHRPPLLTIPKMKRKSSKKARRRRLAKP
jgi:hypothetical protein